MVSHARSQARPSKKASHRAPKRTPVPQGPKVTRAFGYILYEDTLRMWAEHYYYEKVHGKKVSSLPPDEREHAIDLMLLATLESLPSKVYTKVPGLPRLQRRLILMDPISTTYLFVLQDNSSAAALNSHVSEEDLVKMAEVLKITDQKPNWYHVRKIY